MNSDFSNLKLAERDKRRDSGRQMRREKQRAGIGNEDGVKK